MKSLLKSIGKALLYFFIFIYMQMTVSSIISIIISSSLTINMKESSVGMDKLLYMQQVNNELMKFTNLIIIISGIITIGIFFIIFICRKKNFFKELSIKKNSIKVIIPTVIFGFSLSAAIGYALSVIPFPEDMLQAYISKSNIMVEGSIIIKFIAIAIIAPIVEEITFRGLIYTRLKKGMPIFMAAIITSLLFGLVHGNLIWILYAFVLSLILIWIFENTKSLTPCIIFHISFNIAGIILDGINVNSDMLNWLIFGGSVIICVIVFLVIKHNCYKSQGIEKSVKEVIN